MATQPKQSSRWPLTGREGELDSFANIWADRRCRGVVIYGAAGVGKSRLAEECLARTAQGGWKCRRATASTAAAAVPLGSIAHLIPPGVDLSDPVRGFAAVATALAGPQRDRRWAVWVDDLHLLDTTSAVLLRQLIDAGVVRLIGTVRTGEPVGVAVDALCVGDAVHRIDLAAFSREQARVALEAALGGPVERRTLHELYAASGGNILYLRELVLGALASGSMASDGELWEMAGERPAGSQRLAELITARLSAADPAARLVLELLALAEPLSLADAEQSASPDLLTELEQAGLVQVATSRRRTTVQLAHPLYGEVLRADISDLRRRTLLLRQAERTQDHGARRRGDILCLASWQLAATGTADPALLIQAATLARYAHDGGRVVSLLRALPQRSQTTATRLMQGDALIELGRGEAAEAVLAEAYDKASGEPELLATTVPRLFNIFWRFGYNAEARKIKEAAQERVTSPAARHSLALIEAGMRTFSGEPRQGLSVLEHLDDAPGQTTHLFTWMFAAAMKSAGLAMIGRTIEAVTAAERFRAEVLRFNREQEAHIGVYHPAATTAPVAFCLNEAGRLDEARRVGQQAATELLEGKVSAPRVALAHTLGRLEWMTGHVVDARRWFAECAALAQTQHQMRFLRLALVGVATTAAALGDLDAAEAALSQANASPRVGFLAGEDQLGEAWLLVGLGRTGEAREVLGKAARTAQETGHVTSEALLLTEIARLGGAHEVAERLAALAEASDGVFTPARAHLAAALAADHPGRLMDAADELAAIGAHLLAAEAATAAATAWQRAGQSRRAAAATQRAQSWSARCQGAQTPLLKATNATICLTDREDQIARLAAAGTASKDIAGILHLSVRTVDLQHAYTKLGVTTRAELGRFFRIIGLTR